MVNGRSDLQNEPVDPQELNGGNQADRIYYQSIG